MGGQRSDTDRRQQRRLEQARLRSIVEQLADGIIIVGSDGMIRFANPAAERLFGRPAAHLSGNEFGFTIVVGETTEVDVLRPGGVPITAELRVVEIDWENEPARLVSLRDITDRRRADERARQLARERAARAQAEAASQAKSEFLAMMSHELRTPLNAVIGYAELLDLGIAGPLTSEQRHQLSRIRTSGQHLLGLVNEVLDLAKIEAGGLSVHTRTARAGATADAALALVQGRAEEKAITFAGQCLGDGDATYDGDEDRVRQILVNLLANAVKFTDSGGRITLECGETREPNPEARLHGRDRWVYVSVKDTGIGIPSEQLPLIFDPFVQAESGHTRSNDGSGLGLTISRRLARLMGGDLTVQSTPGKGSTFTLWLPHSSKAPQEEPKWTAVVESPARLRGLSDVGAVVMRELDSIVESLVMRIRAEEIVSSAKTLRFSQLADHLGSYLADVAGMLIVIEESGGQPSALLSDGAEIQRMVAERHGAQRARLGWTVDALRREYEILREELNKVVRRTGRAIPQEVLGEAQMILERFVEQSEQLAVRALGRLVAAEGDGAGMLPAPTSATTTEVAE
jgi:signal transduction histidine kinase